MDIRDNIKIVLTDKGFKQSAIAKKANMPPGLLSSILTKNRKLEANELFALCEAMEITPEELHNYTLQKENHP